MFRGKKTKIKQRGQRKSRYDQTLKRIKLAEKHVPGAKRITQHPKYKHYVPPAVTIIEVAAALIFTLLVVPYIIEHMPKLPLPDINIPTPQVNVPTIDLPTIPLPSINLPKWLKDILYWLGKTWPIWIAVYFAVREIRKNDAKKK